MIAIKEGADLDLSCPIVVQNEDMIISWTCDDEPASVRSSRIHVTESGKLRIKSAKVGDTCNYRCEAADGYGTLSVVIKVIIVDKLLMGQLARPHNSTTGDQKRAPASALPEPPLELEVQVEPALVEVAPNASFSLECRTRHAQHLGAPQIIWLKEFLGAKPASLGEAHEQNLVKIDDVYYHSLNWPRSMSYSQHQLSLNSALLVRQASQVHAGRYLCFAGYPPASFRSRLQLSSGASRGAPHVAHKLAPTLVRLREKSEPRQPDLSSSGPPTAANSGGPKELLVSVFASNSWMRNLAIALLLVSGCLYATKSILIKLRFARIKNAADQEAKSGATEASAAKMISARQDVTDVAIKSLRQQAPSHDPPTGSADSTSVSECRRLPLPALATLADGGARPRDNPDEGDHLYSEICEPSATQLDVTRARGGASSARNDPDDAYKVPAKAPSSAASAESS